MLDPAYAAPVSYRDQRGADAPRGCIAQTWPPPPRAARSPSRSSCNASDWPACAPSWRCTSSAAASAPGGALRGVVYITGSDDVARTVTRVADELALPAEGVLRLRSPRRGHRQRPGRHARDAQARRACCSSGLSSAAMLLGAGRGVVASAAQHAVDPKRLPARRAAQRSPRALAATRRRRWSALALLAAPTAAASARASSGAAGDCLTWAPGRSCAATSTHAAGCGSAARAREDGERVFIASAGRDRARAAMARPRAVRADDRRRPRQGPAPPAAHVAAFGATGSGKTTSVLRAAAGRTLADHAALLLIDQKGDPPTEEMLRRLAATARRPFILLGPQGQRHRPLATAVGRSRLRSSPARSPASRPASPTTPTCCASTSRSSRAILHAAGHWPPSLPAAVRRRPAAPLPPRGGARRAAGATHPAIAAPRGEHEEWVSLPRGQAGARRRPGAA